MLKQELSAAGGADGDADRAAGRAGGDAARAGGDAARAGGDAARAGGDPAGCTGQGSAGCAGPAAAGPVSQGCCTPLACEPLSAPEAEELAPLFKAIADPARLRLLSLIACHEGGEACVCELTGAFELTGPTISHHLKVLREAGLIGSERRGTWVYYWVNPGVLARLSTLLTPRAGALAGAR